PHHTIPAPYPTRRSSDLQAWEDEKTVETDAQLMQLLRDELPFHFHGEPPPGYAEDTVPSPEVLRYFAQAGYGDFDYGPKLRNVEDRKSTRLNSSHPIISY